LHRIQLGKEEQPLTKQSDHSDIVDRLETAVSNMTEAGIARLCRKGAYLAIGTPDGDAMALLNEAIMRTLNGSREWKPGLPFEVFIFGVMKSIAHAQKHSSQQTTEVVEAEFSTAGEDDDSFLAKVAGGKGTDAVLIERHRIEALQADVDALARHFEGDDDVELVLAALEDGTARQVLIEDFGMTITRYESARKKLRRGADTIFRGRRKS
jgi:DNA-directed RNA polymerase specialized sigma24 family protein